MWSTGVLIIACGTNDILIAAKLLGNTNVSKSVQSYGGETAAVFGYGIRLNGCYMCTLAFIPI